MAPHTNIIVAFDLYDTLLSTESISRQLVELCGDEKARAIALLWRRYLLEYTWRLNSIALGRFDSYTNITKNSFQHALTETGVSLSQEEVEQVMVAYDSLSAFPDVPPALQRIRKSPHITPVIFSNGQRTMVNNSVMHSADLSPHAEIFQDIITVDDVQRYKPTPEVYFYLAEKVGKQRTQLNELWLVSGNPFDITGAKNAGLRAAWVDRAGIGWRDRMIEDGVPDVAAKNLEDLIVEIEKHVQ